jgi:hypothetical protein
MTKLFLDGSRSGNMVPAPIKSSSFFRPEKTGKKISAAGTSILYHQNTEITITSNLANTPQPVVEEIQPLQLSSFLAAKVPKTTGIGTIEVPLFDLVYSHQSNSNQQCSYQHSSEN